MDRISGLPDELLVKILLLVPTKLAVSTSALSKRWEFLWMWLPKLEYVLEDSESKRCFLNKYLPLHKAPIIETFSLDLSCLLFKRDEIKLWVVVAISHCVRDLEITYGGPNSPDILPSNLYTCKSLVVLKLDGDFLVDVPRLVFLPSLKTLKLVGVRYSNGESIQRLLSNCPILEHLSVTLREYDVTGNLVVVQPSLQRLSICIPYDHDIDGIVIENPSLKYFKLQDYSQTSTYYLTENMPNLILAFVDVSSPEIKSFLGSMTSVKRLEICSEVVYDEGFVFNQLEHLKLCRCKKDSSNLLARLLKDSSNLQVLELGKVQDEHLYDDDPFYWNEPSTVPGCILWSLQTLKMTDYDGQPGEKGFVVYILQNACHLKTARIESVECRFSKYEMIQELTLSSRASTACQLIFESKIEPDVVIYNSIIDSLGKYKHVDNALALFIEMENKGVRPDVVTYSSLISCLCSNGRWSDGSRLLRDMIEKKIDPDVVTFSALIDAFAKEGKLLEAEKLYKEMIQRSIDPNNITYSSLINGFCMHGRLDKAKDMFDLMVSKGCPPNVVTYSTLINGFCKSKRVEDGMELFREMSERGLAGNTITYNTLIQGFFQAGDCENAQIVFKQMVSDGVPCSIMTYNILLDGLCKNGKLEKALIVFQDLRSSGMELDISTYNIMIEGMCKDGKLEDGWDLFNSICLKGGAKPDVITYNTMISGFCRRGLREEANDLFRKMKEERSLPDSATYNTLIRAHLRVGDKAASVELFKEMKSCGFAGDASTFKLVADMLHDGRLDRSFLVYDSLNTFHQTLREKQLGYRVDATHLFVSDKNSLQGQRSSYQ